MALTQMTFDKVWTNPVDFPTYEPNEQQVRADMQYLFDAIRDQHNSFLTEDLIASNIPFEPTTGKVTATDVQSAIEFVHDEIASAVAGDVPAGSISSDKLKQTTGEEAVITEAIRNGAITTDKINNGAVTFAKTTGVQKVHTMVGPVTVATSAWNSSTLKATVTVNGVSLANVATQKVDWAPADRATWSAVRDNGVWVLRTPPADNRVTLECEKIPATSLSLYFCILD